MHHNGTYLGDFGMDDTHVAKSHSYSGFRNEPDHGYLHNNYVVSGQW
jgi:hypothetical protein